ncbi:MAG: HupE/UreJ family protein [Alphaproteobacteria bacterium]|nr:HupE/UreJ family protein [Alphaproteobacteria bacterium]
MSGLRLLLAFCCVLLPSIAGAHVTATGIAVVAIEEREVRYRLTVVPSELPEAAGQLLTRAMAGSRADAEQLADAMRHAVAIRIDGAPCQPGRVAVQDIGAGMKALLDYTLHCETASGRFELEEDWGDLFGAHYLTIATIRSAQGSGGEHLLGQDVRRISLDLGMPAPLGLAGFVRLGIEHILTGYDHLLFLFALLIGATSFWRVLGIASMFTLAHSITLSIAVLGLVHPPPAVIEPLIAASIVWVAVENTLGDASLRRRYAITFGFGLVHGLGFADALQPLALSGWPLVRALAGFNIGVEIGQAIAIVLALPIFFAIGRLARAVIVYRYASVAVAAAGTYWLVERLLEF